MKVTLNIAEDQEIRKEIRDLIKGQVASIIRTDLQDIVRETIGETIRKATSYEEVSRTVKNKITEEFSGYYGNKTLKDIAREEIIKLIKPALSDI